jgi:hypothetical protein
VIRLDGTLLFHIFDIATHLPQVDPPLNLFGITPKALSLGLSYFDGFPDALWVSFFERTYFHDLHLFIFYLDELVIYKCRYEILLGDLGVDGFRQQEIKARDEVNPKYILLSLHRLVYFLLAVFDLLLGFFYFLLGLFSIWLYLMNNLIKVCESEHHENGRRFSLARISLGAAGKLSFHWKTIIDRFYLAKRDI